MSKSNIPRNKPKSPLTLQERVIIELRYREGKTQAAIAEEIDRDKGTLSREIGGRPRRGNGAYTAVRAHEQACARIENRGNVAILDRNTALLAYVIAKLTLGWSPEQISIRLPLDFPDDQTMRISCEAIYQYIYAQVHRGGNGAVKPGCRDLRPCLPRRHKRRARKGFRKAQQLERKERLPSIETRPKIVERRSGIGHWEDDLIVSSTGATQIKSINERRSGIIFFGKTLNKTAASGDAVVCRRLRVLPRRLLRTLTRDRGSENMGYLTLEETLGITVYFAHAYSSYERGSNENGNGLFRRYFPKKTNWDTITEEAIARVEYLINSRPRKRLGGRTPYEVFYQETGVALIP